MNIINLMKRRPVASYFILVFLISWGGSILLGGANFLRGDELELGDALPMVAAMLIAPFAVGIAMTYITDGRNGLNDLFARMRKWRVAGRWYLALLIFPGLILAVLVPLSIWVTPELTPTFFPIGILSGLFAGFLEETGWMGFAYPKMRLRMSVLRASILLGLVHATWHAAADFLGNFNSFGENWLPYFAGFFVFVVALRVIIAWIYENTQSVLLAQLAHASSTGSLAVLLPMTSDGATWPIFYAVYVVALWLVAALIIVKNRESMTDKPAGQPKITPSWQSGGN